jgi:hypothetical protein
VLAPWVPLMPRFKQHKPAVQAPRAFPLRLDTLLETILPQERASGRSTPW